MPGRGKCVRKWMHCFEGLGLLTTEEVVGPGYGSQGQRCSAPELQEAEHGGPIGRSIRKSSVGFLGEQTHWKGIKKPINPISVGLPAQAIRQVHFDDSDHCYVPSLFARSPRAGLGWKKSRS